jgi:archaellum biogenesis ATPase FlaH
MQKITDQFITQMFKSCLTSEKVLAIVIQHMKYEFLGSEKFKKIYRTIVNQYRINGNRIPNIGLIYEANKTENDVIETIEQIENTPPPNEDDILNYFNDFIKQSKFVQLHNSLAEVWGDDRHDEAFSILQEGCEKISNFSIKPEIYGRVYADFETRQESRKEKRDSGEDESFIIPTLIDEVDLLIGGGIKKKQTFLLQAQSGYGKSTFLRWIACAASRSGQKVLFISAEDSQEDVETMLDSTAFIAERNSFSEDLPEYLKEIIEKSRKEVLGKGGEVFVRCFEQFGSATMSSVLGAVNDVSKIDNRPVDMVILDYLEKFQPIGSYSKGDKRQKRLNVAEEIKNAALETDSAWVTATQGSTVDPSMLNDPTFVQTRYNISELKSMVDPFSYFATLNMTKDEREKGLMRIYFDKLRYHEAQKTILIYQDLSKAQFYLPEKTRNFLLSQKSKELQTSSPIIKKRPLGRKPSR